MYNVSHKVGGYLDISQADIAAWSYGALIALNYALHHPWHVRSLTLIEPSAYWVLRSRDPCPGSFSTSSATFNPWQTV
jgi:pimeloyl-ACP methyl ester carboxylesterase